MAAAHGVSVAPLEQALVADAKTHLDAAVQAGRLTAAQETQELARLTSRVDALVHGSWPPPPGP